MDQANQNVQSELQPEYATMRQITDMFAISSATIYRKIQDGNIKAKKIGKKSIRIFIPSVREFFEKQPDAEINGFLRKPAKNKSTTALSGR